jgi:hypothetical protein
MVSLPRDITAGRAARRAFLADLLIAIILAVVALSIAAGIGVVGFVSLLTFLVILLWTVVEAIIRSVRHRFRKRRLRPAVADRPARLD